MSITQDLMSPRRWPSWAVLLVVAGPAVAQATSIANTKHNLSASGPGAFRAETESRICFFCHAPHKARTQVPLWNREDSKANYLPYQSSTLAGNVAQPNGSTKLCLSCHDGTVALGKVIALSGEVPMTGGRRFLNQGIGFLGVNLRDDHPLSFHYDSSKGGTGIDYRPRSAIAKPVVLDDQGRVQCTSCHDPHSNLHGYFLRQSNTNGQLCLSCHSPRDWDMSAHNLSSARWSNTGPDPWPKSNLETVSENACGNCHHTHSAASPARLLKFAAEEENCLRCHNGNVAKTNIASELAKVSHHPVATIQGVHDAAEDPASMGRHSECQDCHNPHAARSAGTEVDGVPGPLVGVSGVNSAGQPVARISFEYELCYKCHNDTAGVAGGIPRDQPQPSLRRKFAIANPSFHPIESRGRNNDVPSLMAPWNTGAVMRCTDCHSSNASPAFGGTGPSGPHGSTFRGLLGARYDTIDNRDETPAAYALCYKCHSRASILSDTTFKEHRKHIVEQRTPCSVCHDPHGVEQSPDPTASHSKLINFDISVVQPSDKVPGVRRYRNLGYRRGSCTLKCHGEDHNGYDY